MRIYFLTELIKETAKDRPYIRSFYEKIIIEIASGVLENLFFNLQRISK